MFQLAILLWRVWSGCLVGDPFRFEEVREGGGGIFTSIIGAYAFDTEVGVPFNHGFEFLK